MYKFGMKKINFAVSDTEYQNLQYLKTLLGFKTDASCFRFCLEHTFSDFDEKKEVCSNPYLNDVFTSFRSNLYGLLRYVKK